MTNLLETKSREFNPNMIQTELSNSLNGSDITKITHISTSGTWKPEADSPKKRPRVEKIILG
tara:strand:- start:169636 stop:169821 length:186 start_codon:yes stop_codon:yes gene_type:complete